MEDFTKPLQIILILLIGYPTLIALVKGAPFVPTPLYAVRRMLKFAKIKPNEKIYDIGCGDGRLVHLASKLYHAQATGFELSPAIYLLAKICQLFWRTKAKIRFGDFRKHNLSDANVIVCYMLPATLKSFQSKFDKELKKGTRVVSYAFPIGDWKPVLTTKRVGEKNCAPIWMYEIGKNRARRNTPS